MHKKLLPQIDEYLIIHFAFSGVHQQVQPQSPPQSAHWREAVPLQTLQLQLHASQLDQRAPGQDTPGRVAQLGQSSVSVMHKLKVYIN